jgi:hypothetical protein
MNLKQQKLESSGFLFGVNQARTRWCTVSLAFCCCRSVIVYYYFTSRDISDSEICFRCFSFPPIYYVDRRFLHSPRYDAGIRNGTAAEPTIECIDCILRCLCVCLLLTVMCGRRDYLSTTKTTSSNHRHLAVHPTSSVGTSIIDSSHYSTT